MSKSRLDYLDWAKAIGICLIITGHFLPYGCWLKVLFYSFHVPLFALVGGMLCKAPATFSECFRKIPKTFLRLFVPYFIWFAAFSIPHLLPAEKIPGIVGDSLSLGELAMRFVLLDKETIWNLSLWFLPGYLIISVFYPIYLRITKGSRFFSLVFAGVVFLLSWYSHTFQKYISAFGINNIMGLLNIAILAGFFALGYAIKDVMHTLIETIRGHSFGKYFLGITVLAFSFTGYAAVAARSVNDPSNPAGYFALSLYKGRYGRMDDYIIIATLLCILFILVCGFLPRLKTIRLLSESSYFLTLTHYAFLLIPSFQSLPRSSWKTDMIHSIGDSLFIILIYIVMLHLFDKLSARFPKLRPCFRFLGI